MELMHRCNSSPSEGSVMQKRLFKRASLEVWFLSTRWVYALFKCQSDILFSVSRRSVSFLISKCYGCVLDEPGFTGSSKLHSKKKIRKKRGLALRETSNLAAGWPTPRLVNRQTRKRRAKQMQWNQSSAAVWYRFCDLLIYQKYEVN